MNESVHRYPIVVVSLSEDDGGGFLAYAPDLYGCVSDGESPEEAAKGIRDAILEWCDEARRRNRAIPEPGSSAKAGEKERRELIKVIKKQDKLIRRQDEALTTLQSAVEGLSERVSALLESESSPRLWGAALVWAQPPIVAPRRLRDGEKAH